ncbi:MAG: hypothetical protein JWO82_2337 [Akkermansiaceae bacterium]|nr:hypothetical protein [Akkermansiaceae bacterium]
MSAPTKIERDHYAKLVGRQITAIIWEEMEGQALPILLLTGRDRDGNAATAAVLMDPEGNGPGHLDHNL